MRLVMYLVVILALMSLCIICNIVLLKTGFLRQWFINRDAENQHNKELTTLAITTFKKIEQSTTKTLKKVKPSWYQKTSLGNINLLKLLPEKRLKFNFTMIPWRISPHKPEILADQDIEWTMLVAMKSHYKRHERRDTIRETWGSYLFLNGVRLEVVFVIATPTNFSEIMALERENEKHGDLLQVNQTELYDDIGLKAIAAMQWVSENLPSHWIYCSADDDVLPDLKKMHGAINYLKLKNWKTVHSQSNQTEITALERIPILCELSYQPRSSIFRDGPWVVSKKDNPNPTWPPFCLGGFYSMPVKVASGIYSVSRYHVYFHLDDVWITGLLRLRFCDEMNEETFAADRTDKFCLISRDNSVNFKHLPKLSSDELRKEWQEREKGFKKDQVVRRPERTSSEQRNQTTLQP